MADSDEGGMFSRFTDRARRVVVLAEEEARTLDHNYVGTEHVLLGLIREGEGVACQALKDLGISLAVVRQQVEEIIGQGQQAPSGHIPFTPRAKKALELSLREAWQLGHNYVGTEHILLGLIREGEDVAAQVLVKLGAELNRVRQQVIRLISGYQEGPTAAASAPTPIAQEAEAAVNPDHGHVMRNLTQAARENRLDPVVGRGPELDRLLQVLARRNRSNPVLVGDPGVGKTAIVNAFAQRIARGEVPEMFRDRAIYVVDPRAEAAPRLREFFAEARRRDGGLLLFVEDLETVYGAATPLATLIQYLVGDKEAQLISTGAPEGFRRVVQNDQRLLSVLQDVTVAAPEVPAALQMMKAIRDRFEAYHRIAITDAALVEAVRLGERYIHDRGLPASALDLLDEAGSRINIQRPHTLPDLRDFDERIAQVRRDKETAIDAQDFDRAGHLRDQEKQLIGQRTQRAGQWTEADPDIVREVDDLQVREVVEQILNERIDNESAAPTSSDRRGATDLVLPDADVWTMA